MVEKQIFERYLCSMPHPSVQVANQLLAAHGDVSHMKLQKLLYYANGWWLATHGEPLLNEPPQVWRYGPVFRGLYGIFARFGHSSIGTPVSPGPFPNGVNLVEGDNGNVTPFLDWIWQEHGHKTAGQLSDETHALGTPWRQIAEKHNFRVPPNTVIEPELDYDYFANLAKVRGVPTVPLCA